MIHTLIIYTAVFIEGSCSREEKHSCSAKIQVGVWEGEAKSKSKGGTNSNSNVGKTSC